MKLHLYLARRMAMSSAFTFLIFTGLSVGIDLADQARARRGDVGLGFIDFLQLSLLAAPATLYTMLPLITLIASIALFLRLSNSSELVVIRASGRSALRALSGPCCVALGIGAIAVAVLNPVVAFTSNMLDERIEDASGSISSTLSINAGDLWLRQGSAFEQTVIHAQNSNLEGTRLIGATFISTSPEGRALFRITAREAELIDGGWQLNDVKVWPLTARENPEAESYEVNTMLLPSELTPEGIRDSFGAPMIVPFWALPEFIDSLMLAGFSPRRHLVWYHMQWATPAFLMAMVLVGASFTMGHSRARSTGAMVVAALIVAFVLYFVRNFAQILGENGQIDEVLAAWIPAIGSIALSLGLILHMEDG